MIVEAKESGLRLKLRINNVGRSYAAAHGFPPISDSIFKPGYQVLNVSAKSLSRTCVRPWRGQLLIRLFLKQNHQNPYIPCSPENLASIKIIEVLGAKYIETVDIPEEHEYRRDCGVLKVNRWIG